MFWFTEGNNNMNAPAQRLETANPATPFAMLERDVIRKHTDAPLRLQG